MSSENNFVLEMPRRLDRITQLLNLNIPDVDLSKKSSCVIDFRKCSFGEPLPMLLLGRDIKALVRNNPNVSFTCRSIESNFRGYADHIGFFRYCGFARGQRLGEAQGSRNYIPITFIDVEEKKSASGDRPYAEIVEEIAAELAIVLVGANRGGLFSAIQYYIREILRNSFEHSTAKVIVVFGQFWPARSQAEIVLYDTGIGIRNSFECIEENSVISDADAILHAIQPGITSVSEYEQSFQDKNWRNSGFGLFVTSQFVRERGLFRMLSGRSGLTLNKDAEVLHDWRFDGTCVQMKIDTSGLSESADRILELVAEGERILGEEGLDRTASKGSKSISSSKDYIPF